MTDKNHRHDRMPGSGFALAVGLVIGGTFAYNSPRVRDACSAVREALSSNEAVYVEKTEYASPYEKLREYERGLRRR